MGQEIREHNEVEKMNGISSSENTDISAQITAQVTMALSTLDSRYKENVANYAQELHACTHKIETARISLELLRKEKEPHKNALLAVEKEIDHEMRMLEHFTELWIQKTLVVSVLEMELKERKEFQEKDRMFKYRHKELNNLQHEIGDLELILLKHELEKENILLKMEPIEQKMRTLQKSMQEFESKKRYIESSYLHRITQVIPPEQQTLQLHQNER
jgi:chromosome segregation ATPase